MSKDISETPPRAVISGINCWCRFDEEKDVTELVPNPRNYNKHPDSQIALLAKIIRHQGWRQPIAVSKRSGFVVKGHGRLQAAQVLNVERVPVEFQDYATEADEYADLMADNRIAELAEPDMMEVADLLKDSMFDGFDLELTGFDLAEVDGLLEPESKDGLTDEDAVPEVPEEPTVKLGQVWRLGDHRLMCGDSTKIEDIECLMAGQQADMVFTDPPYGVSVVQSGMVGAEFGVAKKGNYSDVIGDKTTDTAKAFYDACMDYGFEKFIIWGGNYFTDFLAPSRSWVVWNKRGDTSIRNTFADGEMAWSNLGHPMRIHGQLWNGMIRVGEKDKRVHPTQKPIALAEFCFELMSDCCCVFDGFLGSGSTLIACEKTNRKCYGMELDPHYCDVIIKRWEEFTGKKAELVSE